MNIQGIPSLGTALAPAAATNATASSSSSSSSATQTANSAEQTFIQLLVTELQSQDPTSPMDPTTMVGQMFEMNQLQQLIDINQTLSTALNPSASASASSATAVPSNMGASLLHAATLPTNAAASYAQQLLTGAH